MTIDHSQSSPPGLRARKQRRQRVEIIENAVALFRESPFDSVPVRAIADRCQISEATFFNYFPCKDAVLAEWAAAEIDDCFESVADSQPERPLRRQVREAVRQLASRVEQDRELMREAWSRARVVAPRTGRDGARLRGRVPGEAGRAARALLEGAAERGEVRADVPAEQLADLLLAGLQRSLAGWLADPEPWAGASVERCLLRAADLLLDGFRKRNERVRVAPSGGPVP